MAEDITLPNGLRVHLQQRGAGRPVVCVPGWACSGDVFLETLDSLAANGFRAITYDPRGQGRSGVTDKANTYRRHGQDLQLLIERLELDRPVLVGWSLGVYDLLSFIDLQGHAANVRALVLVDESPVIVKETADSWGEGTTEEVAGLIGTVATDAYLPFFRDYMAAGFEGEADAGLLNRLTETAATLTPKAAAQLLEDARSCDFRRLLTELDGQLPILQLLRRDWADAAGNWLAAHTPNSEIEVLGGHLMLMEYPQAFNQLLLDFLQRLDA